MQDCKALNAKVQVVRLAFNLYSTLFLFYFFVGVFLEL